MLKEILQKHWVSFSQVIPFDGNKEKVAAFDLSANNTALTPEIFADTKSFIGFIDGMLESAGARYGIGGYLENRNVYARSRVFDALSESGEARSLHLGIDIWGTAGTPVMAPLDGVVHSTGNHPAYGNYGAVILLAHKLENTSFFTLYGHLSFADLIITPGQLVKSGEVFAHFGPPAENGQWPPHLHFQVMQDLQGHTGDYPGVCAPSERDFYARNCPDPSLLLKW